METFVILTAGLTGGIASGKSTVAAIFARLGCTVTDADEIVSRLYERAAAGYEAVVAEYGRSILRGEEIDRRKLAEIAFASPHETRRLNALIHPLVIAEEKKIIAQARNGILIFEATLLLEAGGKARYDRIVVTDTHPEAQIDRAVARGMSREEVRLRMARQLSREDRLRYADYVIDTSGDLRQTEDETRRVYARLADDLQKKKRSAEAER